MSEYLLPESVLRSCTPKEIRVDGIPLLVREPTGAEYAALMGDEMTVKDGKVLPKPSYSAALIRLCVVEPQITDANTELKPAFMFKLAAALEAIMGGSEAEVKNGCRGSCSCTHSHTPDESI